MAEAGITTLELVGVKRKALEDYRRIVGADLIEEIHDLATQIKGVRVLHVNATPPRVAEWPSCLTRWCLWSRIAV